MHSYLEWLVYVQTTPDAPGRLRRTLDCPPLQRLDLGSGRIQEELDLLLDARYLETIECDDLVAVIDCGHSSSEDGYRGNGGTHDRTPELLAADMSAASRQTLRVGSRGRPR